MNRRLALNRRQVVFGALIAAAAVALGWVIMTGLARALRTTEPAPVAETPAQTTPAPTPAVPRISATLFFASEDGSGLVGVQQEVPLAEGTVAQARALVEAQLSAAAPAPLVSAIPEGTALRGVFVSSQNEAFVDLDAAVRERHPGGSMNELFTVYAIVNTLTTNLRDVESVQLLIDGREVDTLAGHMDLRRPLRKNDALIRQ
jgi:spore germination protein GerM